MSALQVKFKQSLLSISSHPFSSRLLQFNMFMDNQVAA
jgi:hypothetical protein